MRYSKYLHVGPGGIKCNCCFPAPGSKERKKEFRRAKRKEKQDSLKYEMKEMAAN